MLDIPSDIDFGQVALNQTYVRAVDIRNPLSCPVEFSVRPGSDRFSVSPCDDLTVEADSRIRLILRLRILKSVKKRGDNRTRRDIFHVKSKFFEQKFYASYDVLDSQPPDGVVVADNARLLTKPRMVKTPPQPRSAEGVTLKSWVSSSPQGAQPEGAQRPPKPLQPLQLPASSMSSQEVEQEVRMRLNKERRRFEEDSAKALEILLDRDRQITELQQQLSAQPRDPIMNPEAQLMVQELERRVALLQGQMKDAEGEAERCKRELLEAQNTSEQESLQWQEKVHPSQ